MFPQAIIYQLRDAELGKSYRVKFVDFTKPRKRPPHLETLFGLKPDDERVTIRYNGATRFSKWIAVKRCQHARDYRYAPVVGTAGTFKVWLNKI